MRRGPFLHYFLGASAVGTFAILAYPFLLGNIVITAMGQAAAPQFADAISREDASAFRRVLLLTTMGGTALGLVVVVMTWFGGRQFLTLVYSAEYRGSRSALHRLGLFCGRSLCLYADRRRCNSSAPHRRNCGCGRSLSSSSRFRLPREFSGGGWTAWASHFFSLQSRRGWSGLPSPSEAFASAGDCRRRPRQERFRYVRHLRTHHAKSGRRYDEVRGRGGLADAPWA